MTQDEIIEMAIKGHAGTRDAIRWAIKQALAAQPAPVQEPVAWFYRDNLGRPCSTTKKPLSPFKDMQPLYTTPPAAAPAQEPVLQEVEQYRLQMAGISTAAIGYWKEGDGILPDYDTPALRDVAKLYAKYDELYKAQQVMAARAVPDAFGTREGEHPEYIQGWNDCRAEMLKGMKP
jgi:hypothetical protein